MVGKDCKTVWDNIPSWAIYALEYGMEEDPILEKDEEDMIKKFISGNFPNGYTMSVDWDSRKEFNPFPAFGKPCATYKVTFNTL